MNPERERESDETEPMSSKEEREQRRGSRSKSKERGRTASRRTAKGTKPKGRSQRMMSVQRTDSEGDDSFEEMGGPWEDFASSGKLAEQLDQNYKALLETRREAVLVKIEELQKVMGDTGEWFDETGTLAVENQTK